MGVLGYCDPLRGRPGDTLRFMLSSDGAKPLRTRVVRVIHADPNPAGPGMKLQPVPEILEGFVAATEQHVHPGSCLRAPAPTLEEQPIFHVTLNLRVLRLPPAPACLMALQSATGDDALALLLAPDGGLLVRHSTGSKTVQVEMGRRVALRRWHAVGLQLEPATGRISLAAVPLGRGATAPEAATQQMIPGLASKLWSDVTIGALWRGFASEAFTGQIERPRIDAGPLPPLCAPLGALALDAATSLACWDFSLGIDSQSVRDLGPSALHGRLVNLPTRAVRGSNWTGREMSWRHASEEYGAIHFHADDIGDAGWSETLSLTLPAGLASGIYALQAESEDGSDLIPFFVLAPREGPKARIAYLASTLTYQAYANHRRGNFDDAFRARVAAWGAYPRNPDQTEEFGASTYNYHPDGTGIALSSRLRPILTLRPGFLTFHDKAGSGLRHFSADTHLVDWMTVKGFDFDVVTDEDLDDEGAAALDGYQVVITGSHPEYHTERMLDALSAFRARGGHFLYMGGNGFYWRIARRQDLPHVIEVRRAESGIRAWASEPGEYYHQLDGSYGGLWRRNARPPQQLAGVGFAVQGLFEGSVYRRTEASFGADVAWVFDGVAETPTFGGYGLSGGGAAGFELDQVSPLLGTEPGTVVLARSEGHGPSFQGVPENILTHTLSVGEPLTVEAHMILGRNEAGGQLFATGSITFLGSLSHNGYDNAVSTILGNVLRRFSGAG